MKKRLISIVLTLLMAVSIFAGCDDNGSGSGSIVLVDTPMTLTLYCITDEKTTEAGIEQAEKAINEITEYDFATHIELKLFTADEYEDMLLNDLDIARKNYTEPVETTTEAAESETETGEEDEDAEITTESRVYVERDEIVYPKVEDGQVDIILITSIDLFNELLSAGDIQPIDSELKDNARLLTKFVNPTLLNAATGFDGSHYGVPNNRPVGEYEYLLLRRDIVDQLSYSAEDIHTLLQLEDFINDVRANVPNVTPLLDTYGVSPLTVSMIEGTNSLFGSYVGYNAQADTNAMPRALPSISRYRNELGTLRNLKSNGSYVSGDASDDMNAAAVFLKGDITAAEKYAEDYYVNVYRYPTMTNENAFNSYFAVSTYSKSLSRSMSVINSLMTDADLRNAFQYGQRDVNYSIDKNDFVTIQSSDYVMDPIYTGNMFLLYQNDGMSEDELALSDNNWELAKKQIVETVASPYFGFSAVSTEVKYADEGSMFETQYSAKDIMDGVAELCETYQQRIDAYDGSVDFAEFLKNLGDEMNAEKMMKAALNTTDPNSPNAKYIEWYKQRFGGEAQ